MGQFSYKAVNSSGGHVSGIVEAADRKSAVATLAQRKQFVVELSELTTAAVDKTEQAGLKLRSFLKLGTGRVAGKDILAITNQLGAALRAGLPLLDALKIIAEQQNKAAPKELVEDLARSVSSGQSLSEAMSKYPETFGPLYVSMVRVGETGGILDKTLEQLITILQRNEKVKTSIRNASAYPLFVLCVGLISVIIVVTWILPRILGAISGGIAALPWPTRMLMAVSDFVKSYGLLAALAIAAVIFLAGRWIRGAGRVKWDSFKLRTPIIGQVLRTIAVGRFARTLGALTKGGVTILESLGVVRDTLGNEVLAGQIDEVAEKVKTGSSLAGPLGKSGFFPPLLVQIVSVGEQTGQLDELLLNAADTFDDEADAAIAKFMAVFPALLILLLALIIGFIIAATLLPIVIMELGAGAI